jgi:FKBP-type peptidyl-prolyl cis-trans isomerase FklB
MKTMVEMTSRKEGHKVILKMVLTSVFCLLLLQGILWAEEIRKLESEVDRISYSIGQQIGRDFKRQGVDLDPEALLRGFRDANTGDGPVLSQEEMNAILGSLKGKITAAQRQEMLERRAKRQKEAEEKRREGQEFLTANQLKPGVKTMPSGLQYKVIRSGSGKKPGPQDTVRVHYRARLIDGREFDSSSRRNGPSSFSVGGVIPGLTEALQLMREGARWELYLPPELAFGRRGPLADQTVIYEIELLGVGEAGKAAESKPASKQQP